MYVFECRAECRTHSSIFKVCFILNAELNVELTARYSRCMFSNAELNVEPIARYSKCVLFWMQSWTSISQLDILIFLVLLVEYRAEYRSHSSIFADYVCQYIAEYRLLIPLPTSQTWFFFLISETHRACRSQKDNGDNQKIVPKHFHYFCSIVVYAIITINYGFSLLWHVPGPSGTAENLGLWPRFSKAIRTLQI